LVRARDLSDLGSRPSCAAFVTEGWTFPAPTIVVVDGAAATCP
jgi:hypothetical protein